MHPLLALLLILVVLYVIGVGALYEEIRGDEQAVRNSFRWPLYLASAVRRFFVGSSE